MEVGKDGRWEGGREGGREGRKNGRREGESKGEGVREREIIIEDKATHWWNRFN